MKEITINVEKSITLNVEDRLYTAMVTVYDKPNYAVYTLGHDRSNGTYYYMLPTVKVVNFVNQKDADFYHEAIQNIMKYQSGQMTTQKLKEFNADEIAKFYNDVIASNVGIQR
jgi:hypothetical protein